MHCPQSTVHGSLSTEVSPCGWFALSGSNTPQKTARGQGLEGKASQKYPASAAVCTVRIFPANTAQGFDAPWITGLTNTLGKK